MVPVSHRILIVEDDRTIARAIAEGHNDGLSFNVAWGDALDSADEHCP